MNYFLSQLNQIVLKIRKLNIAVVFGILIAILLPVLFFNTRDLFSSDFNKLEKYVPSPVSLVTSPAVLELIELPPELEGGKVASGLTKTSDRAQKGLAPQGKTDASPTKNETGEATKAAQKDIIAIEKIKVLQPIVTTQIKDTARLHGLLDSGVVLYPDSAAFGKAGQTVLLGHSAPDTWPNIKHDRAFSKINELTFGDEILISYAGKVYRYIVARTQIIDRGGDLSGGPLGGNTLVLVTCWPPGRNLQRIAVEATLDISE